MHFSQAKPRLLLSVVTALLSVAVLPSCGDSDSSPSAVAPESAISPSESGTVALLQASPDGTFALPTPIPATDAAGRVRLDIASKDALPSQIALGSATFQQVPLEIAPGFQTYMADVGSLLEPLEETEAIAIPGVESARIRPVMLGQQDGRDAVSQIYRGDPTTVTFEDFVLTYMLSFLPVDRRSVSDVVALVQDTYPGTTNITESLVSLSPPTTSNTDWARGGRSPAPDLADALVVYSTFFLQPDTVVTETSIANLVAAILPESGITAADIVAIPGQNLPAGPASGLFIPDIIASQGEVFGSDLVIEVEFAQTISSASSGLSNAVGGLIEIDFDQNFLTGIASQSGAFLGVDAIIDLYTASNGTVLTTNTFNGFQARYPISYSANSLQVVVPYEDFRAGLINYSVAVGTIADSLTFTDITPDDSFAILTMPSRAPNVDLSGDTGSF
ncbi:MAG: hypothetical protein AAFX40_14980 [Cyanobacteria bacterium J06639_1]